MHWILATSLMFVSSVALYLALRHAALSKLPVYFNNLAAFAIPLVFFLGATLVTHTSLAITWSQLAILLMASILFAYISNRASLKSVEIAPNPGYSLMISKSYVVLTTFLAIPLLGATLSSAALLAILLIVGFSALIMLDPQKNRKIQGISWLPLALVAFFGWAFLSLVAKYLFNQGMPTLTFLTYLYTIVTLCILVEMQRRQVSFGLLKDRALRFTLIGIASTGFNYFNFYAISLAPNVGYVNAANAASIGAVTIFAALLFKDHLSARKLVGVMGVIVGLFLLFFTNS